MPLGSAPLGGWASDCPQLGLQTSPGLRGAEDVGRLGQLGKLPASGEKLPEPVPNARSVTESLGLTRSGRRASAITGLRRRGCNRQSAGRRTER